uniref:Uncharacterized protein n=1 Tax=Utricularia reniformis TaxID=192314 RepID=A0A1Y0B0N5_9LAMI|nr:hypothetical protein AEK19_MT0773 [Utricularia reniformis]ART31016.1 hypothetical protein AEK19_MT0773 [Utricularia reniformis]
MSPFLSGWILNIRVHKRKGKAFRSSSGGEYIFAAFRTLLRIRSICIDIIIYNQKERVFIAHQPEGGSMLLLSTHLYVSLLPSG